MKMKMERKSLGVGRTGQDRTGQDMHGMLFGLDSKEGAYKGLKRSEVEFYR